MLAMPLIQKAFILIISNCIHKNVKIVFCHFSFTCPWLCPWIFPLCFNKSVILQLVCVLRCLMGCFSCLAFFKLGLLSVLWQITAQLWMEVTDLFKGDGQMISFVLLKWNLFIPLLHFTFTPQETFKLLLTSVLSVWTLHVQHICVLSGNWLSKCLALRLFRFKRLY